VIVKFTVVAPAGTVTLAGTVAFRVSLLANVTTTPPVGAAALKVIVPVAGLPPITVVGLMVRFATVGKARVVAVAAEVLAELLPAASKADTV
jgi:hypothetical protein